MTDAPAATGTATPTREGAPDPEETRADAGLFDEFERALGSGRADAAIEGLIRHLEARGEWRALLDALLLKARHELGLPPIPAGSLAEMPEPARAAFEDRYVEAIRYVGGRLLETGDIVGAWPYFRAIAEPAPVARALESYRAEEGDERLGQVVEVAFNHGAHPRRGFELILDHYGICSAISAFEHLPQDEATRVACAGRLVRRLHEQLAENLRADIARRGQPLPSEGTPIAGLVEGRDWLFADEAYHIDVSHLASVVRMAPMLSDPEELALAVGLTDYGRRLSHRHRYEGEPPFEDVYEDHGSYLGALVGRDTDAAVARFRAKLAPEDRPADDPETGPNPADTFPAQVLVMLLARLGRLDEAIEVAAGHLAGVPESALACPSLSQLCRRAGRLDRMAEVARALGDPVNYLAARLQARPQDSPPR